MPHCGKGDSVTVGKVTVKEYSFGRCHRPIPNPFMSYAHLAIVSGGDLGYEKL